MNQGIFCQIHGAQPVGYNFCPFCAQANTYQQVQPGLRQQCQQCAWAQGELLRLRKALEEIRDLDYRGNRERGSELAFKALGGK